MYWDVKVVKPLASYQLYVEIENGRCGTFDVKPYLEFGMFRELKNIHYFNQVDILFGAITWPNEQDIAPETLLEELLPLDSEILQQRTEEAESRIKAYNEGLIDAIPAAEVFAKYKTK